jgi:hypothetical protein
VVLVEEETLDGSWNLIEYWKEALESSIILVVLTKKLAFSPSLDDVCLNGSWFCDIEVSIDQVRQVGEVESEVLLVIFKPLLASCVVIVFKLDARICQKKS